MATRLADIEAVVTANIDDFSSKMATVDSTISSTAGKAADSGKQMQTAGVGLAAIGGGGTAFFGAALDQATSFEQSLSGIASVGGQDAAAQMDAIRAAALQMGAETSFSAQEAAAGMEEMIKAGVPVQDTLDGAARGALDLAAATGTSVPDSAAMMANALNIFHGTLPFEDVADNATYVADTIAQVANASASSASDISAGLGNVGPVAAGFGLSMEDSAEAIGVLSNAGVSGAEAGTMMKSMLLSLYTPSIKQNAAMRELGLTTRDFIDESGNLIGIPEMFGLIKKRSSELGVPMGKVKEDMATIFGSYGITAASTFFDVQQEGFDSLEQGMANAGTAQDQAKVRMDNLAGALETLRGSFDTAMIVIGSAFVPAIRTIAEGITGLINMFIGLPQPVQEAIAVIGGVGSVLALVSGGAILAVPKLMEFGKAMQAVGGFSGIAEKAISKLPIALGPLGIALAAVGLAVLAYKTNFLGFGDAVDAVFAKLKDAAQTAVKAFQQLTANGMNPVSAAIQALAAGLNALGFEGIAQRVAAFGQMVQPVIETIGNMIKNFQILSQVETPVQALFDTLNQYIPQLGGLFDVLQRQAEILGSTVQGVFYGIGDALASLAAGDWGGVLQGLADAAGAAASGLLATFQNIGGGILQAFNAIDWGAVAATLYAGLQSASTALQTWVQEQSTNLLNAFNAIDWGMVGSAISNGIQAALNTAGSVGDTIITWAGEQAAKIGAAFAATDWASAALAIVTGIGNALGAAGGIAAGLVDKLGDLAGVIGGWIAAAAGAIHSAWDALWSGLFGGGGTGGGGNFAEASILPNLGDLGGVLSEWVSNAAAALGPAWEQVKAGALTALQETLDGAQPIMDAITTLLVNGWQAVSDGIGPILENLLAVVTNAWTRMKESVALVMQTVTQVANDTWNGIVTSVTGILANLQTAVGNAWTAIQSTVTTSGTAIQSTITTAWTAIQDATQSSWQTITTIISTFLDTIGSAVQAGWQGIQTTIATFMGTIQTTVQTTWQTILSTISTFMDSIVTTVITKGQEIVTGFITKLEEMGTQAATALAGVKDTIVGFFADAGTWLYSAGAEIIRGLVSGITDNLGAIANAAGQARAAAENALGSVGGMVQAGGDLMGGAVQGVQSKAGELSGAVTGAATGALTDLSQSMKMQSPSLVFAEAGENMMQGLINGVEQLRVELLNLFDQISQSIQQTINSLASSVANTAADMAQSTVQAANQAADALASLKKTATSVGGIEPGQRHRKDSHYAREQRRADKMAKHGKGGGGGGGGNRGTTETHGNAHARARVHGPKVRVRERHRDNPGTVYINQVTVRDERDLDRWATDKQRRSLLMSGRA